MNTIRSLLESAPDSQTKRVQLAYKAAANGDWANAVHYLRNAAEEEGDTPWGMDCADVCGQCAMNGNVK